jgi:hypothetical protein
MGAPFIGNVEPLKTDGEHAEDLTGEVGNQGRYDCG